jgi:hypothetical protein
MIGSLTLGSGSGENISVLRSLTVSWTVDSSYRRGSVFEENLRADFNTTVILSGHYDCFENVIANCGTSSAYFAFLVIAFGALAFGIYVAKQHRHSLGGGLKKKDFGHNKRWERKGFDDEEGWEEKGFDDEERRETKGEG